MKMLLLTIMGLFLTGCQSPQTPQSEAFLFEGNQFKVTHAVAKRPSQYSLLKRHTKEKTSHPLMQTVAYSSEHDGAPSGPLPVSFQKVTPKREPISRYGNPDVYQVNGRQYEVMTNSTGYKRRGIASWYGTKFHAGRTSSGEKYDMYALTAAHKTLPLPTYVRVKNLSNGRTAIVKVNDRGPFHESRIIDLSYAAAAKLGLFPKGTAPVEIEALKTTQLSLHYYVQAGAFSSQTLAEKLQAQLTTLTTSPVSIQKNHNRYSVQVGPFANKDMVSRLKQRLEANHIHDSFSMLM